MRQADHLRSAITPPWRRVPKRRSALSKLATWPLRLLAVGVCLLGFIGVSATTFSVNAAAQPLDDIWMLYQPQAEFQSDGAGPIDVGTIATDGSIVDYGTPSIADNQSERSLSPFRDEWAYTASPLTGSNTGCDRYDPASQELVTNDLAGSSEQVIANSSELDPLGGLVSSFAPVWSPDQSQIAAVACGTDNGNPLSSVFISPSTAGGSGYTINLNLGIAALDGWYQNGILISVENAAGTNYVGLLNPITEQFTPIPGSDTWCGGAPADLQQSPDGASFAFYCFDETQNVEVVSLDGSDSPQTVSSEPSVDWSLLGLAWSPDSTQLALSWQECCHEPAGGSYIDVVGVDGGQTLGTIYNAPDSSQGEPPLAQVLAWGESETIGTSPSSLNVSASPSPGTTGAVAYNVTVTGADGDPTGVVYVDDNVGGSCAAVLNNGNASCSIEEGAQNSPYGITAQYFGDATYAETAGSTTEVVSPATPSVLVSSSPNPGQPGGVTYSVNVTGVSGITPTGSATVTDGAGGSCTATLSGGSGQCEISEDASATAYTVTASYSGDGNYLTATASTSETVNQATPTVFMTATPNASNPAEVAYAVLVTGTGPAPTGTVEVNDGRGMSCTVILNQGSGNCTITEATASDGYLVTGNYSGDVNYTSAGGVIVPTPTLHITPSANPAISGPVIYSASVTGTGPIPTGSVEISDGEGGTCTATLIAGGGGCALTENAGASPYTIAAAYSGDSYYASTTTNLTEVVNPAVATVTFTPSSNPANEGPVTYTVLVTGNGATPTGTVTVDDGEGNSCTATLVIGVGNCAVDEVNLTSPYSITATYNGDENYSTASATLSNARGVSVGPTGTAIATLGASNVTATGEGTVNILQYASDPVGSPSFSPSGVYFDASNSSDSSFRSEVIQDCDLQGGTILMWWNPAANSGQGAWQPVVGDPGPSYTSGPPACISVTLDSTTSPSISELTGTVFGLATGSQAPQITSASSNIAVIGLGSYSFTVTTSGSPVAAISESGALPTGLSYKDNGNGTATISGTLSTKAVAKSYPITLTATNSQGTDSQTFVLNVAKEKKPAFVTAVSAKIVTGVAFSYTVEAVGIPTPSISESGTLPSGMGFTPGPNGSATLTGTPTVAAVGTHTFTITAVSAQGGSVSKTFTLTVEAAPS